VAAERKTVQQPVLVAAERDFLVLAGGVLMLFPAMAGYLVALTVVRQAVETRLLLWFPL
jgi:hypothetical protein